MHGRGAIGKHAVRLLILLQSLVVSCVVWIALVEEAARTQRICGFKWTNGASTVQSSPGVDKKAFVPATRTTLEQDGVRELFDTCSLFLVED